MQLLPADMAVVPRKLNDPSNVFSAGILSFFGLSDERACLALERNINVRLPSKSALENANSDLLLCLCYADCPFKYNLMDAFKACGLKGNDYFNICGPSSSTSGPSERKAKLSKLCNILVCNPPLALGTPFESIISMLGSADPIAVIDEFPAVTLAQCVDRGKWHPSGLSFGYNDQFANTVLSRMAVGGYVDKNFLDGNNVNQFIDVLNSSVKANTGTSCNVHVSFLMLLHFVYVKNDDIDNLTHLYTYCLNSILHDEKYKIISCLFYHQLTILPFIPKRCFKFLFDFVCVFNKGGCHTSSSKRGMVRTCSLCPAFIETNLVCDCSYETKCSNSDCDGFCKSRKLSVSHVLNWHCTDVTISYLWSFSEDFKRFGIPVLRGQNDTCKVFNVCFALLKSHKIFATLQVGCFFTQETGLQYTQGRIKKKGRATRFYNALLMLLSPKSKRGFALEAYLEVALFLLISAPPTTVYQYMFFLKFMLKHNRLKGSHVEKPICYQFFRFIEKAQYTFEPVVLAVIFNTLHLERCSDEDYMYTSRLESNQAMFNLPHGQEGFKCGCLTIPALADIWNCDGVVSVKETIASVVGDSEQTLESFAAYCEKLETLESGGVKLDNVCASRKNDSSRTREWKCVSDNVIKKGILGSKTAEKKSFRRVDHSKSCCFMTQTSTCDVSNWRYDAELRLNDRELAIDALRNGVLDLFDNAQGLISTVMYKAVSAPVMKKIMQDLFKCHCAYQGFVKKKTVSELNKASSQLLLRSLKNRLKCSSCNELHGRYNDVDSSLASMNIQDSDESVFCTGMCPQDDFSPTIGGAEKTTVDVDAGNIEFPFIMEAHNTLAAYPQSAATEKAEMALLYTQKRFEKAPENNSLMCDNFMDSYPPADLTFPELDNGRVDTIGDGGSDASVTAYQMTREEVDGERTSAFYHSATPMGSPSSFASTDGLRNAGVNPRPSSTGVQMNGASKEPKIDTSGSHLGVQPSPIMFSTPSSSPSPPDRLRVHFNESEHLSPSLSSPLFNSRTSEDAVTAKETATATTVAVAASSDAKLKQSGTYLTKEEIDKMISAKVETFQKESEKKWMERVNSLVNQNAFKILEMEKRLQNVCDENAKMRQAEMERIQSQGAKRSFADISTSEESDKMFRAAYEERERLKTELVVIQKAASDDKALFNQMLNTLSERLKKLEGNTARSFKSVGIGMKKIMKRSDLKKRKKSKNNE